MNSGPRTPERRRRLTREQRRQRVTTAAVEVFAERGYRGASMADVSQRAGITKPTLYDHFASKREMYLAVLEMQRDEALRQVLPQLQTDLPPRDAVANALEVFFAWGESHPSTWRLIFREPEGDDGIARRHRQLQSEAYLAIASSVLNVSDRGDLPDRDLRMMAEVVGGGVHRLARWWWYDHPDVPRAAVVAAVIHVMWTGLERLRVVAPTVATVDSVAGTFVETARVAAQLLASPAVTEAWDRTSTLEGYTVGALGGHLARAVLTVETYLSAEPASPDAEAASAARYFAVVLADHHPVDSDFHRSVRRRARDTASIGAAELAASVQRATDGLAAALDEATLARPVGALEGVVLTVADYLKTRLVELVVHMDDLAVSAGVPTPPIPRDAWVLSAGVLGELAALRVGGLETVRALARAERQPAPVRAL